MEKEYNYDHRGNLLRVQSGNELLKQFQFDAANQMERSMGMVDGTMKQAAYQYNGLGHRMNQTIWNGQDLQPERPDQQIQYTLDLTRQYHNMLQKQDRYAGTEQNSSVPELTTQNFYWDGNITAMEMEGKQDFYLQDDLGSPISLMNQNGQLEEQYSYDEFGTQRIYTRDEVFQSPFESIQPFGFTGYQMDEAGGLYFAQARRYDAGAGRFVSEDFFRGLTIAPFTLNHYGYCWNRPMDLVDLNGKIPTAGAANILQETKRSQQLEQFEKLVNGDNSERQQQTSVLGIVEQNDNDNEISYQQLMEHAHQLYGGNVEEGNILVESDFAGISISFSVGPIYITGSINVIEDLYGNTDIQFSYGKGIGIGIGALGGVSLCVGSYVAFFQE